MQVILLKVPIMQRTCHTKRVGILLYIVLVLVPLELFYYMGERPAASIVLLGRLRLLMIPALRRDFPSVVCEGQCKPSVVEHSLRAGTFVECEGNEKSGQTSQKSRRKGVFTGLPVILSSSMSAEPPPKSRIKGKKVCSQQPGKPVSSLHPDLLPTPQGR